MQIIPISISIIVTLLAALLAYIFLIRKTKNTILLIGPPASGKTRFITKLTGQDVQTVTSMVDTPYQIGRRTIVDCPGHERLSFLKQKYLKDCDFVVLFLGAMDYKIDEELVESGVDIKCICAESLKRGIQSQLDRVSFVTEDQLSAIIKKE